MKSVAIEKRTTRIQVELNWGFVSSLAAQLKQSRFFGYWRDVLRLFSSNPESRLQN